MKTILQKIGPLYGEPVNGTVFGQPNGSQAVLKHSFVETIQAAYAYIKKNTDDWVVTCDSTGTNTGYQFAVKIAYTSPVPVHFKSVLYSDSSCTVPVTGGYDNTTPTYAGSAYSIGPMGYATGTITTGTTYYLRVDMMYAGDIIKKGTVIPVEAV